LQKVGRKVIAGDFSTFDGTLNTCIMWAFVDVINEWYDDGEDNAKIRRVLFLDVVNSVHLCRDVFYNCDHSQPSGNPITTVLNSFYNSVSMRIVFELCKRENGAIAAFDNHVSMVSYGDDNVVNISDAVPWFNQNSITEGYAKIGMIYTDESKSSGVMANYRTIGEVTYLKRYFKNVAGDWLCPLEFDALIEGINWIRDVPDDKAQTIENCETAFRELFHCGEETFLKYQKLINKVCSDKLQMLPAQATYQELKENRHYEFFL